MKIIINILIVTFFLSCNKEEKQNTVILKIHRMVDSISKNLPRPYYDFIYTVTYQKKEGKQYVKIAIADYFNKDSVSTYEIYNDHLLIFYSKDFFEKQFDKLDTIGLNRYNQLEYDEERLSLYHPRYEVIELLDNNQFRILPSEEHHKKKLFYFSDVPEIPEPVPHDSLMNKK